MKTIFKAFKFRLDPTNDQKILLAKHFGSNRFIYNHYLSLRKETYLKNKKCFNYYDCAKDLTNLKKNEELIWLNEVSCQSLQASIRNLDVAYTKFFKKQTNFPKFKSKSSKQSFSLPQNSSIKNGKLHIIKFKEGIKINLDREIDGKILFVTVSKTPTNKYFASLTCEISHIPSKKTKSKVGIDTGIKNLAILSNGKVYENIKSLKQRIKQLKFEQRKLSKKKKGSSSKNKQRVILAKIHEKVTNVRKDHLHKVSTEIVKNHDVICIENLDVKKMMSNHIFSKELSDVALGMFYDMLEYKANWNDKIVVKIDRYFPSSKTCFDCNYIHQDLSLKDRAWECKSCHATHDRDLNASRNILRQGLKILRFSAELSGLGTKPDIKQKRNEALPTGKSVTSEIEQSL